MRCFVRSSVELRAGTRALGVRTATLLAVLVAGCAQQPVTPTQPQSAPPAIEVTPPPMIGAPPPAPAQTPGAKTFTQRGKVSMYGLGDGFAGKKTASGDAFDPQALTMAHPTLPFGTRVRVTNLENRRSVEVTVNDRGPQIRGRIADLSVAAAQAIGMVKDGVVDAVLEVVGGRRD
jgi:rare lipoprotein A